MNRVVRFIGLMMRTLLIVACVIGPVRPAWADLRSAPAWYDQNAVSLAPDWHYRVPISVPAGASVNSTVKIDVDFTALLSTMGVSGTFDVNSPRVVRSTGALSTIQEFTDRIFAGGTDAAANGRGEVRFILEDAGPVTYYLYFDITQNAAKPANPQTPINGNFERGGTGAATPTAWNNATIVAGVDGQIRPNETVNVTANPAAVDGVLTRATDGSPKTGDFSYLMGNRSGTTGGTAGNPGATLTKTITVPATNPGSLTFSWRPEGWDTGDYDPIRIDLVNAAGTTVLVEMVGPTAGNYVTRPFAPNIGGAVAANANSGYRQYNGYDCTLLNVHTQVPPMTVPCRTEPWWTFSQSLAAYAGQTIQIRIRNFSDTADKTWYHIDDVEWSVVTATLGTPQGFGINITAPAPSPTYFPGQVIPAIAQVDAVPTAATSPMMAALFNAGGTQIAGPFLLYNDGTHGDVTAGDALWSNSGSIVADAISVPLSAVTGAGYILRAFGRDGSTSTIGAQNGLIRGPGTGAAAETQPNYWTIDELPFSVQTAAISLTKTSSVVNDPVNGVTNPKMIPGATVRYCLLVSNAGPLAASNIVMTDSIPPTMTYVPGTMKSGPSCAAATTVEDDDAAGSDESDPIGSSFSGGTVITITSTVANGGTVALVFDVIIN